MISLLTVDVAQIGQGARGAPWVSGFPESCKRTLIQLRAADHVALCARDVALLVDGPGGAAAIAKFLENVRRLAQCPSSARIVAANLDHVGKIVKTTRDGQPVRQQTPAGEASLKVALGRGVVTAIPRRDRQSIQRCGDAGLIAQFFIEREALFQRIARPPR